MGVVFFDCVTDVCISLPPSGEIDARADSFTALEERGAELADRHEDIPPKLEDLRDGRQRVLTLWDERLVLYNQCMDLQLFYRLVRRLMTGSNQFLLTLPSG